MVSRKTLTVLFLALMKTGLAAAQFGPAAVVVSEVQEREVSVGQTYVGTVQPSRRSEVGSAVDGRVTEFFVNDGDFIEKDKPLAQLLTETIRLEVEANKAELTLREQELAELKNGARPEEIGQARALAEAARARAEYQKAQLKRVDELFARKAVNEDERHLVVSEAISAEQMFLQADESRKLVEEGPRVEKIAQAEARVAMQGAIVQRLQDMMKKHTIKAPFDGYVVAEHTEVGQWIQQGALVAVVVELSQVDVLVHVQEAHISHVARGVPVRVEVPALPGRSFDGVIEAIVPQADLQARTFPVRVRVNNEITASGPAIMSGMLARVILPTGPKQNARLIPKDALVLGPRGTMVFVVTSDPKDPAKQTAAPVPVEVGAGIGRLIEVRGPLKKGDRVVVRGNERLRPPSQDVKITETLPPEAEPTSRAVQ